MGPGPWAPGHGLRALGHAPWAMGPGPWALGHVDAECGCEMKNADAQPGCCTEAGLLKTFNAQPRWYVGFARRGWALKVGDN